MAKQKIFFFYPGNLMKNILTKGLHQSPIKSYTEGIDIQQTDIATYRLNWPRGQFSENPKYARPLNLLRCADISTLLTPPLCTLSWLAKTEIYVLVDQPTFPVFKNHRKKKQTD